MNLCDMVMQKRILIADDDEIDRKILERWCTKQSYLFTTCTNGQEAIDRLKLEHFDLLISDLDMPVMSGLELIKNVKKLHINIPCIAVSANEDAQVKLKALEFGFDGFIPKLSNYKELGQQITFIVNDKELL